MNLESYKRLHKAMEIPPQGTGSPFRDLLERMFAWNANPLVE